MKKNNNKRTLSQEARQKMSQASKSHWDAYREQKKTQASLNKPLDGTVVDRTVVLDGTNPIFPLSVTSKSGESTNNPVKLYEREVQNGFYAGLAQSTGFYPLGHPGSMISAEEIRQAENMTVASNRRLDAYATIMGLTAEAIQYYKESTITGRMRDWIWFYQSLREKDPDFNTAIFKRKIGVTSKKLEVKVVPSTTDVQNPDLILAAELLKKNIENADIQKMMTHLLDATFTGFSVAELDWEYDYKTNSDFFQISIPSNSKFAFDENLCIYLDDPYGNPEYNNIPLKDFTNKFIVHLPGELNASLPTRDGLLRTIAPTVFMKFTSLYLLAAGLERTTFGQTVIKSGPNTSPGVMQSLANTINRSKDRTIVVSKDVEVLPLTAGPQGGDKSYMDIINFYNDAIYKGILGGTMTTEDGSSRSQAEVHERGENKIVQSDALKLLQTLQKTLVYYFFEKNKRLFPNSSPAYLCENIKLSIPGLEGQTRITKDLFDKELVTKNEVRSQMNLPLLTVDKGGDDWV